MQSKIRLTVSVPEYFYEDLRLMAYEERRSIGSLLVEKAMQKKTDTINSVQKSIEDDFDLFEKVALSGININSRQAIREERSRDNA